MKKTVRQNQKLSPTFTPIHWVHLNYLFFVLGIFVFPLLIIAMIINYIKEDDVAGSWLHTHYIWQAQTFWKALLWYVIGLLLCLILIGVVVIFAVYIWYLYRMIKGWIALSDGQPMQTF